MSKRFSVVGQSLPKITRVGPKCSSRCSTYGRIRATDQAGPSSVTRPDSFTQAPVSRASACISVAHPAVRPVTIAGLAP